MTHTAHMIEEDNRQLEYGDEIRDFRGEIWEFRMVARGPETGRSAKVQVARKGITMNFYASVFPGLEVI